MMKEQRLAFAPVLIVDLGPVVQREVHVGTPFSEVI
jgi:hypothetical protein